MDSLSPSKLVGRTYGTGSSDARLSDIDISGSSTAEDAVETHCCVGRCVIGKVNIAIRDRVVLCTTLTSNAQDVITESSPPQPTHMSSVA